MIHWLKFDAAYLLKGAGAFKLDLSRLTIDAATRELHSIVTMAYTFCMTLGPRSFQSQNGKRLTTR